MVSLEDIKKAPESCGVYLFKSKGRPIYIGKAKNIKSRLLQHFKNSETDPKERSIVTHSDSIEWIVTRNEYEAITLEIDLIQLYKPKYNVMHKHGSGYPVLVITQDTYPTVKVVRGTQHDGIIFGPFFSMHKAYKVKKLIHKLYKLRTCDPMPQRSEPCMDYHIGLCSGPCCGLISKQDYRLMVDCAVSALSGEVGDVLDRLYNLLEENMKNLNFERCALIRDQILSLERLAQGQKVSGLSLKHADVFYSMGKLLGIFLIRSSKLVDKKVLQLDSQEEISEILLGFYYSNPVPPYLVVNFPLEDEVKEWLQRRGALQIVQDMEPELKELIEDNMGSHVDMEVFKEELARVLKIPPLYVIEGFDVSNFYGEFTVGSCVVWEEGLFNKKRYRRYRIRTVEKVDDYASLGEVLTRRARRLKEGQERMPDAWLIDGGLGQLSVAIRVKERFSLPIRVFSLAKGEEVLFCEDGRQVRLKEHPVLYRVFGYIRDEAHRFAISYNRHLRRKEFMTDILDRIKGIGEVKKKLIYSHFENLYEFIKARDEELRRLGIDPAIKQEVERYISNG